MLSTFNFRQKYLFLLANDVTIETAQYLLMAQFQSLLFSRVRVRWVEFINSFKFSFRSC